MKTIFFFTVEVGIAHITRSLAIAEELHKKGHRVIFALPKRKQHFTKNSPIEVVDITPYVEDDKLFATMLHNFRNYDIMLKFAREEKALLEKYKPDLVVTDFRISAVAAALSLHLPTVFVTGSGGLPDGIELPNIGLPSFIHKLSAPLVQQTVGYMKRTFLKPLVKMTHAVGAALTLDEIFNGMVYIVPEVPNYLKALNKRLRVHYVGPIFGKSFDSDVPEWLSTIKPTGKTVYISFGGTGFNSKKLIELSKALVESGHTVVVSCSSIADPKDFPQLKNLFVTRYLPGAEVCKRVDILLTHGGYGTTTQGLLAGKPFVALPFNPDQILHAFRYQELGLGRSMLGFNVKALMAVIKANWNGLEAVTGAISTEKIVKTVQEVLNDHENYEKRIQKFIKNFPAGDGSIRAADIIAKL